MAARSAPWSPRWNDEPPLRVAAVGRRHADVDRGVAAPPRTRADRHARRRRPPPRGRARPPSRSPASSRSAEAVAASGPRHRRHGRAAPRSSATSAPPVPRSVVASVQPRARAPRRCAAAQVVSPRAQTNSAERGADRRLGLVGERPPAVTPVRRRARRSARRPPRGARRWRRPGWPPGAAARRGAPRPATRRCRGGAASGRRCPRRRPVAARRGRTWSAHIGRISRGGPGSVTITRPSGPVDPPAGRRAVGVRQSIVADGITPRLLDVDRRERLAAARPQAASQASVASSTTGLAAGGRDRLAGEVVRRRAEAAGGDDEVGARRGRCAARPRRRRGRRAGSRSRDDRDAVADERAGELAAVGVAWSRRRSAPCRSRAARR